MSTKLTKINVEDQLLQLRKDGLQTATQINAMNAHGKILGMDTPVLLKILPRIINQQEIIRSN